MMRPMEIGLVARTIFVVMAVRMEAIKIVIMFSCCIAGTWCQ